MFIESTQNAKPAYRKLVSVKDTLKRIPVSKTQIGKLYAQGLIEGQHIGKRLFLYEDSIEEFIEREKLHNPRDNRG